MKVNQKNKNILKKEDVLKLTNNPNITKKEFDAIIDKISLRVEDIWPRLIQISGRRYTWYSFSNDEDSNDGGSTGGSFDPILDKDFIEIIGQFTTKNEEYYKYNFGFPTYFLWTDDDVWEAEVMKNVGETAVKIKLEKENIKKENEKEKLLRKKIINNIKKKLTKEELKYINFK